jgi:hypothetical protein
MISLLNFTSQIFASGILHINKVLFLLYFLVSIPCTTSTDHGPTFVLSMLMLSSIFVMICDLFE